jgi:acetyl-CoA carboxylase alpha subunit
MKLKEDEDEAVTLLSDANKYMVDLKKIESAYKKEIVNKGKEVKKVIEREENLLGNVYVRIEDYRKQNEQLAKHVDELTQLEQNKRARHKEFFYIDQYITLFEELQ